MSKILLIGASGTIGQAVLANLGARHEVITVGRSSGAHHADLSQPASLAALFAAVGKVDAIVSTAGNLHFGPLTDMTAEQFNLGLQDKLLGQVQLALLGHQYLHDGGSITLISGILSTEPIRNGANATAVNAAIEGFVAAAAIELPRGLRINAVSPTILTESVGVYGPFFPGFESVPAKRVALAYQRSVEGAQTGRVYRVQ
ncbi:MAG: short chain dehydrogenase [Gammaproteobacteria bacterium]|nr:short chain dehydrogenase [Gammaproteobacteria bacterium]MBU1504817.1 short chain dehydrogenase [Gammaproteobacteria bacterium]MBU2122472.1 short chain dehydrogenase [Gammaproteobacteria bacterium]MBU2172140.1 short chain dehydrogenase [Gammaproteobacteria bacterium]MBU2198884.1 short chain dehydrogenase [Gammaproteobacteria bacterium]